MDGMNWQVLSANRGKTNIVGYEATDSYMKSAFANIVNILSPHCGPFSKFAMIVDPSRVDHPPKFTKDGINILRATEFLNPLERTVRDEVAYIGQSTERIAGDGTTSAMLIVAIAFLVLSKDPVIREILGKPELTENEKKSLFKKLLIKLHIKKEEVKAKKHSNPFNHNAELMYTELCEIYQNLMENICGYLDEIKGTYKDVLPVGTEDYCEENKDSYAKAIEFIAYSQAMTSSHGDVELSEIASKVFATLPPDAWPHISFIREQYETSQRLRTTIDTDQYRMKAKPVNASILNTKAGTQFHQSSCTVITMNQPFTSDDAVSRDVLTIVESCKQQNVPVVIVCPHGLDSYSHSMLNQHCGPNFAVFLSASVDYKFNDIVGLQCVANVEYVKKPIDIHPIVNCDVTFVEDELIFNNLYEPSNNVNNIHPLFDVTSSTLRQVIDEIEETIEIIEKQIPTSNNQAELNNLRKLRNRIKYTKHYAVRIGGSVRDNTQAIDVVADTLIAIKNTLVDGFVPAGNMALSFACYQHLREFSYDEIESSILHAIIEGIDYVLSLLTNNYVDVDIEIPKDELKMLFIDDEPRIESFKEMLECCRNGSYYDPYFEKAWIPIQPVGIEKNIVRRFGDTVLKYLYTDKMIFPGGTLTAS